MIAVYIHPESLTKAQYEQVGARLGADDPLPSGMKHHSCFGEDGQLMVYDVWESQAQWDAAWQRLAPLLEEAGVTGVQPVILPVVDLIQP